MRANWSRRLPVAPVTVCCSSVRRRARHGVAACPVVVARLGTRYVTALCALPGLMEMLTPRLPSVPSPPDDELDRLASGVPPMTGAEYLTVQVLAGLWRENDRAFDAELAEAGVDGAGFPGRRVILPGTWSAGSISISPRTGRMPRRPSRSSRPTRRGWTAQAKAQHLPLGRALLAGIRRLEKSASACCRC